MTETTTTDDVRARIQAFVVPHMSGQAISDSDDYFALGYVNSLFAMQLAVFVQKEFGIVLKPEHMDFDNFRTVNGLVRLVGTAA